MLIPVVRAVDTREETQLMILSLVSYVIATPTGIGVDELSRVPFFLEYVRPRVH
jgi:hypothetical protein